MVFHKTHGRNEIEMKVLRNTIKHYIQIIKIFEKNKTIDKACVFPDKSGICWFNFFWCRGSFLKNLPEPKITNDRYYYEQYIGQNIPCSNLNLHTFNLKTVTPLYACRYLRYLPTEIKIRKPPVFLI
jgi:hypothetical protein